MRTFNVTVDGAVHVVRARDFLRPSESLSGRWCFLDAAGNVLWSWPAASVTAVLENVKVVCV